MVTAKVLKRKTNKTRPPTLGRLNSIMCTAYTDVVNNIFY